MELLGFKKYVDSANQWLSSLSTVDETALRMKPIITQLKPWMENDKLLKIHDSLKSLVLSIMDQSVRAYFQVLILQPVQKWLGKIDYSYRDPRESTMKNVVSNMMDPNYTSRDRIRILRDGLTKGARPQQLDPKSITVYAAMNKIIAKLAALNQPLRNRPDYGTTGDVAERLKRFQDDELDAAMYKEIKLPNPKPVAVDYDDPGAGCCPKCHGSHREPVLAHCMDGRFKRIRSMLKGRGEVTLSGAETKTILDALDDIHKKYRELEDR